MSSQLPANTGPSELRGASSAESARESGASAGFEASALSRGDQPKARVLVVEDDPFVRAGIADLLEGRTELMCCGEAGSIAAAGLAVAEQRPDLVLMDLRLEDGDAFGLIHTLRLQFPAMAILVLTHHDEVLYAERAFQAGARGYLMKEAAAEHLVRAINAVLAGGTYLSATMLGRLTPTRLGAPRDLPNVQ